MFHYDFLVYISTIALRFDSASSVTSKKALSLRFSFPGTAWSILSKSFVFVFILSPTVISLVVVPREVYLIVPGSVLYDFADTGTVIVVGMKRLPAVCQ